MQKLTEEAETSAPLLARKLYDTYRRARTGGLEDSLRRAAEATGRNFREDARREEAAARKGISDVRRGVEDAAKGVLGNEAEALRLAKGEIDRLIEEARRDPSAQSGAGGERGQPAAEGAAGPVAEGAAPITGEGYRAWAERLRDVEDLLEDQRLRQSAARIQDRARALRADFKRHSRLPGAGTIESQILAPLAELRERVAEELRRASGDEKLAPVDRDPVPARFSDMVRRYYRSLAEGR
jgi:hypothetical protein